MGVAISAVRDSRLLVEEDATRGDGLGSANGDLESGEVGEITIRGIGDAGWSYGFWYVSFDTRGELVIGTWEGQRFAV